MRLIFTTLLSIALTYSFGQNYWSESKDSENSRKESLIKTTNSRIYDLDKNALRAEFNSNQIINIPTPDGSFVSFKLSEAKIMSPGLKAKYPNIKAFNGISLDGKYVGNFDYTKKGFHAMIKTNQGLFYIDPTDTDASNYQVYYKSDFINTKNAVSGDDVLAAKENKIVLAPQAQKSSSSRSSGTELRTYRMAITCTGEYASFHGGTVEDALSAIVTTLNRVNGIYEREVGIALELIADTDLLLYTDSSTDPYNNSSANLYIDEVQTNIDDIIGDANYDIGHGFSTGAGGLAGSGPCISGRKATGVTGTNSPIGDPYDVDYVAHEVGHQFGANHTFNGSSGSCNGNRSAITAYEPGSGTTILAYAGICAPQNIQSNSDAFMHTASFDEILAYSVDGSGNSCPTITSTGNNPPVVDAGGGGYIIPINTPFSLTGSATDPDGHNLTYLWEQFDLGPAGDPNVPEENAPIFRSFPPSDSPTRTFPQLSDILDNTQTIGEILPSYERTLTFRLTARDNQNGGGGVSYDEISLEVSAVAGPFIVNSFNTSETILSNSNVQVEWDVANTNLDPISCDKVNILLSIDGGNTFDYVLKSNTANDGLEQILIPNVTSTSARIKIEASNNIFFDINNSDIVIEEPTNPQYNITASNDLVTICSTNEEIVDIEIGSILGFTTPVELTISGLSDGLEANLGTNTVIPGNSTTLTISNPSLQANGQYEITILASDGTNEKSVGITLDVFDGVIEELIILSPVNGETDLPLSPTIIWDKLFGETTYLLDIATDELFSNIIISETISNENTFNATGLLENTTYFLRMKYNTSCENSEYIINQFTTAATNCTTNNSTNVPLTINPSNPNSINSTLDITQDGYVEDINVINLKGTHSYLGDLNFRLKSPSGTTINLINGICGSNADFDFNFDDEAASSNIPCPATDGGTYAPIEKLGDFKGELAAGQWTLTIIDNYDGDGGQLDSWSLEICTILKNKPAPPSNLTVNVNSDTTGFELNWIDNSIIELGFEIERSTDNISYTSIGQVNTDETVFIDSDIEANTQYYYRVKASSADDSNYSNVADIILNLDPPLAPTGLTISAITYYDLKLTWDDNSTDEKEFIIERSFNDNSNYEQIDIIDQNSSEYLNINLPELGNYFYRVYARNLGGNSDYSNEVNLSTLVLSVRDETGHLSNLYPNPFGSTFTIESNELINVDDIRIFNSLGKSISFNWRYSNNSIIIDLSNHPDGIYYINQSFKGRNEVHKVLKINSK